MGGSWVWPCMTKYVRLLSLSVLTWVVGQDGAAPDRAALRVLGDGDGDQAPPVPPVPVEEPAGDQPQEQVEDVGHGAELCGVTGGPEHHNG